MALSAVKTWQAGEVLTAADLNNEFANIRNNGQLLVQPWVGDFDLDGNDLILDQDADTSIDASTDDTIDITIAGADDFRFTANTLTALSGSSITVTSGNITVTSGNIATSDGSITIADEDSRTNTASTPLTITATTSGSPASGIGTGILLQAESADEAPCPTVQANGVLDVVTAGSEYSVLDILTRVAGAALAATFRFSCGGAAPFRALIQHAITAARTYTLPDSSGTFMLAEVAPATAGATPTANLIYKDSLVKGFVTFQTNGTIDQDLNVSSITDNGVGDWTVNWATAFSAATYTPICVVQGTPAIDATHISLGAYIDHANNPTTSACRVTCWTYTDDGATGATLADPVGTRVRIYVQACGLQ